MKKYGETIRKYLKNRNFYDIDVVEAIESDLTLVYPELKYDKNQELVETGKYNFYYPITNPYFIDYKTGKKATEFLKITIKKLRSDFVIIITPHKTSRINQKKFIDQKICQPVKNL